MPECRAIACVEAPRKTEKERAKDVQSTLQ